MEGRPGVGVSVIIVKEQKVLLGQRKTALGTNTWAFPGGHLEYGEKIEECACREVLEETGLQIKNLRIVNFTNDLFQKEHKHYVTIFVLADYAGGVPQQLEPEKSGLWEWFAWEQMPHPLFLPIENLLQKNYFPFS